MQRSNQELTAQRKLCLPCFKIGGAVFECNSFHGVRNLYFQYDEPSSTLKKIYIYICILYVLASGHEHQCSEF